VVIPRAFELPQAHFENEDEYAKFILAQKKLLAHVSNKDNYRANQYKVFSAAQISGNFQSLNQRRSYFIDCKFSKANLKNIGLTGTYFKNCEFIDCIMDFAIFDNCFFYECKISFSKTTNILAASFCNSIFSCSEFYNCYFQSSSLTNIDCRNARFINCCLDNIIWENAKIIDSIFENVQLENLNLEFVFFENTKFINTMLPFNSIPFAFKCLEYLINTTDNIRISSETSNNGISRQEYIDMIPHLINFYMNTNNYFPLANIFISINKFDAAFDAIKQGVVFSIKIHEYRTLKYFGLLMRRSNFSGKQKSEIFELINSEINKQTMTSINTYNASMYLYEIRDNLLNNREQAYVSFEIYTNIERRSVSKLNFMINSIESMIAILSSESTHYIELRHSSPYQFCITFFSDMQNIKLFIATFYLAYKGINGFNNDRLNREQKKLDIEKTKEEINLLRKGNASKTQEALFDECENKAKTVNCILCRKRIKINHMTHTVYNIDNVDIKNYGDNFQEYHLK